MEIESGKGPDSERACLRSGLLDVIVTLAGVVSLFYLKKITFIFIYLQCYSNSYIQPTGRALFCIACAFVDHPSQSFCAMLHNLFRTFESCNRALYIIIYKD